MRKRGSVLSKVMRAVMYLFITVRSRGPDSERCMKVSGSALKSSRAVKAPVPSM